MSTSIFDVQEHKVPAGHIREYPRATIGDQEAVLYLAVKQYTPRERSTAKQAVTIIGAHANGFPKELYEPLWDELYQRLKAKDIRIRSIWIADVAHQGASGVLNEDLLGNDPSWMDHSRDLFLMINHFRSEIQRPIIGIGHSMGGNNLVNLALLHPRLITTLILADPVIQRQVNAPGSFDIAKASARRRDHWPSREAAAAALKRNKFYQTWDPRVLDKLMTYSLRKLPTKIYPDANEPPSPTTPPVLTADPSVASALDREVTLTTTKHQEVMTFLRPNYPTPQNPFPSFSPNPISHPDVELNMSSSSVSPVYRPEPGLTFARLPFLRPSVLYLFGSLSALSAPLLQADKLATTGIGPGGSGGVAKGRVAKVVFEGVGHLIPMEIVGETAQEVTKWVVPELQRWAEIEAEHLREWEKVPREEKGKLSEEFMGILLGDWKKIGAAEREAWEKLKTKL